MELNESLETLSGMAEMLAPAGVRHKAINRVLDEIKLQKSEISRLNDRIEYLEYQLQQAVEKGVVYLAPTG